MNNLTIDEKLDNIIKLCEKMQKQLDDNKSFNHTISNWATFYIASLMADETVGRNIRSSIRNN